MVFEHPCHGQQDAGTLISQGGFPFGWGLYVIHGRATFLYRCEPQPLGRLVHPAVLSKGAHKIDLRVVADGAAPGAGAKVMLSVDDAKPVEMHLPATVPNYFGQEGVGIGRNTGTAISRDIPMPFRFSGEMGPVIIDLP